MYQKSYGPLLQQATQKTVWLLKMSAKMRRPGQVQSGPQLFYRNSSPPPALPRGDGVDRLTGPGHHSTAI